MKRGVVIAAFVLLGVWLIGCESSSSGGESERGPVISVEDNTLYHAVGHEVILRAENPHGAGYRHADNFEWTLLQKPEESAVDNGCDLARTLPGVAVCARCGWGVCGARGGLCGGS